MTATETEKGNQPENSDDNVSTGRNTSESDGSSQDGSLKRARPTAKPAISESGNGVPQSPRPGEGIELQREPSMESTLNEGQPQPSESSAGNDTIPYERRKHDLESQTAATKGTVISNLDAQISAPPINPSEPPSLDAQSSDPPINPSEPPSLPKTGIKPFLVAALVASLCNSGIGSGAQWLEKKTRPTATPESDAQDFNKNKLDFYEQNATGLNKTPIDEYNATELEIQPIDGQDVMNFTNADADFLDLDTTTTIPNANASNLTDSIGRRAEASPDDETASVYSDSRNKEEHAIYIGDATCGALRGAVATGVDYVNEFGFSPPCAILRALMIKLNRQLDRLPAGCNHNLKDLFGQLCGAIIGLAGISVVYYSLPTRSDYIGNLIINPIGNTFTNILRSRVAKYLNKPAFIGPIQRQTQRRIRLNRLRKRLRKKVTNQRIDRLVKVWGRFCNRIIQLILKAMLEGVKASFRALLIFGGANIAKEVAAALALENAKNRIDNATDSSPDLAPANELERVGVTLDTPTVIGKPDNGVQPEIIGSTGTGSANDLLQPQPSERHNISEENAPETLDFARLLTPAATTIGISPVIRGSEAKAKAKPEAEAKPYKLAL